MPDPADQAPCESDAHSVPPLPVDVIACADPEGAWVSSIRLEAIRREADELRSEYARLQRELEAARDELRVLRIYHERALAALRCISDVVSAAREAQERST